VLWIQRVDSGPKGWKSDPKVVLWAQFFFQTVFTFSCFLLPEQEARSRGHRAACAAAAALP
jgi:hypothetical protein